MELTHAQPNNDLDDAARTAPHLRLVEDAQDPQSLIERHLRGEERRKWLGDLAERFKTVFSQRVKDMDLPALDADGAVAEASPAAEPAEPVSMPTPNGSVE